MKDVLQYLVVEKGIHINSVDKVTFLQYCAFRMVILFLEGKDTLIVRML